MQFGVDKDMLHVKHFSRKILMAVDYCGCQLAKYLGGLPLVYLKIIKCNPFPCVCRLSLQ